MISTILSIWSFILSIWSFLRQRPVLHIRERPISVLSASDSANYYGFAIANRGLKAVSIRNVSALTKDGEAIVVVPVNCLDDGQTVKKAFLSRRFHAMNNSGFMLSPRQEEVFVGEIEKAQHVKKCRFFSTGGDKAITKKIKQNRN